MSRANLTLKFTILYIVSYLLLVLVFTFINIKSTDGLLIATLILATVISIDGFLKKSKKPMEKHEMFKTALIFGTINLTIQIIIVFIALQVANMNINIHKLYRLIIFALLIQLPAIYTFIYIVNNKFLKMHRLTQGSADRRLGPASR